jgi:hypothetical protein
VSVALNSGQCLPAIISFSLVTPTGLAALLALGVNAAYVLAYLIADPEERPTRRTLAFAIAAGFQGALCLKMLREPILAALAIEVGGGRPSRCCGLSVGDCQARGPRGGMRW